MLIKSIALGNILGLHFGYHHHDSGLNKKVGDLKLFDIMLKNFDASLIAQHLYNGNRYHAGGIAVDILHQYPGSFQWMQAKA